MLVKKKKYIELPNPCHENWWEMEKVPLGRHCNVCEKKVIDFTRMTDQQVIEILQKANYKTFGKFTEHQLNNGFEKKKENFLPFQLKAAASAVFLLFSMKSLALNTTKTEKVEMNTKLNSQKVYSFRKQINQVPTDTNKRFLKGVVLDSISGEVIPSVKITLVENSSRTITDIDGKFVLELPEGLIDNFTILVSSYTHELVDYEIHISKIKDNIENYQILLPSDISAVPMIGLVVPAKKKWWKRKNRKFNKN